MIGRADLLEENWLAAAAEDAPRVAQELDVQRENLNLLRSIHRELGTLDYE